MKTMNGGVDAECMDKLAPGLRGKVSEILCASESRWTSSFSSSRTRHVQRHCHEFRSNFLRKIKFATFDERSEVVLAQDLGEAKVGSHGKKFYVITF